MLFDKLEILITLSFAHQEFEDWYELLPGAFVYRRTNRDVVLQEIRESLATIGNVSPFVTSNIFGATVERCLQRLTALEEFNPRLGWY